MFSANGVNTIAPDIMEFIFFFHVLVKQLAFYDLIFLKILYISMPCDEMSWSILDISDSFITLFNFNHHLLNHLTMSIWLLIFNIPQMLDQTSGGLSFNDSIIPPPCWKTTQWNFRTAKMQRTLFIMNESEL